jgi:hypothetical protein
METITFIPNYHKIRWSGNGEKASISTTSFLTPVNLILELVIRNTLKFNKLTSAEEIYEGIMVRTEGDTEYEREEKIDINSIENICEVLCRNSGVLLKLERNGKRYYKLNY